MASDAISWADFERADPTLALRVLQRLESHRHAVLATLSADGAPRLSGMEAPVRAGHLWLAMSPGTLKTADLGRDPRYSLHSALDSEDLLDGDARIDGFVVAADDAQQADFVAGHRYRIEDTSMMVLYVALIARVVLVSVKDNALVIESWTPSQGRSTRRRR